MNVLELLRAAAERAPHRPALVFGHGPGTRLVSFDELWCRIDRSATGLAREGLAPGDRVIVMVPMSAELYVALLAVLKLGAIGVFVDPWMGREQIAAFAAFAGPRAWIGVPKSHLLRLADRRLQAIPITVTTGRRLWAWPARRTLRELERAPAGSSVHPAAAEDSALITFTSGSSATPKGANRTHGFLAAQHRALGHEFPYDDNDVDMPMFPVFALNNLARGIPSVVPEMDFRRVDAVDSGVILEQMAETGVTTCTASPPFFDRLATALAEDPARTPSLRRILSGGAPVSDDQLERWRQVLPGTEIVVVYGSTEAEPVAHLTAEERLGASSDVRPEAPGYCVGRPSKLVDTRLVRLEPGPLRLAYGDWARLEVAAGEVGELVVAGDHVCRDYYRNPEAVRANKITDDDGAVWHRMGDTGYRDGQGRLWLVGRVHSTIVRDGRAVHPFLLEQAGLASDPRVRRVAAVGLPDGELGERAVLVVETDAEAEIEGEIRARLEAAGLVVDEIVLTAEPLPVDPRHNSKIDYPALRQRLLGHGG